MWPLRDIQLLFHCTKTPIFVLIKAMLITTYSPEHLIAFIKVHYIMQIFKKTLSL